MYECNKALDKTVKQFMWVLCAGCYNSRLEKLEEKEDQEQKGCNEGVSKKAAQKDVWHKSTQGYVRLGTIDCCQNPEQDIQSLELDNNPSWLTKKHIEITERFLQMWMAIWQRIQSIFSFLKPAMIATEDSLL